MLLRLEDPIEYYYPHEKCIISQREVGIDTPTFAHALRSSLRQDPDVILVGEMRDLETMDAAISAAETGHLVMATFHTTGAARTTDRIIDAFLASTKEYIRTQLASSILAIVSQTLLNRVGGGRVAAFEIMINTDSIATLIRDDKRYRITSDIQMGAYYGMITLDACLLILYNRGLVYRDEVIDKSQYPDQMRKKLEGQGNVTKNPLGQ